MKHEQPPLSSLGNIEPIQESRNVMVRTREELTALVEAPLLQACASLYDKNIRTLSSSANKGDIEGGAAHIIIDFDSLSETNKEIAKGLGELLTYDSEQAIKIEIPISPTTSPAEIEQAAQAIADKFQEQPILWAPTYSLEDLKKIYGIAAEDRNFDDPKSWEESGYFYDQNNNIFYLSEEHYKKATKK
ncbi:MAG: hypothetical protein WC687_04840 [Patescibacteria group bacterium]|jgi:hypothetical protein